MKIRHWFGWSLPVLALVFCARLSSLVQAATLYVDAVRGFNALDGSTNVVISSTQGPFRNISPALVAAPSNSTLIVAEGHYQEMVWNGNTTWDLTTKSLSLSPQGNVQVEDDFSTAGDGIPDWWKNLNGLSTTSLTVAAAISTNAFAHGMTNLQIYQNPSVSISNGFSTLNDHIPDWWKVLHGYSLLDPAVSTAFGSLAGWWKLDEGTGTNVYDSGANGFNGSMVGSPLPQWTNGVSSNALWFAGTTNDVQVADTTLLSPTNALTLLAWAQVSSNITGTLISKWTTNALTGSYSLGYTNSQVMLQLSVEGSKSTVVGATTNADGGWHLIAGVYDGTQMAVYLDGFADNSVAVSGAVDVVSAPLQIGKVIGTINDIHIYSRGLSADELANYSTLLDGIADWWKVAYGFSITDPAVSGMDPLGEGISNLLAYQYGLDPWEPDYLYVVLSEQSMITNSLISVDAGASPFPIVLASLSSNMSGAIVLTTNSADIGVGAPPDSMTNYTVYLQYANGATNSLGHEFSEVVTVDTLPPTVSFSPGYGGTNTLSDPILLIEYSDPAGADTNAVPSGLNLSTLKIKIDGNDITTNFYIFTTMAIGDTSAISAGWHTNTVSLADNAGNWISATNVFYSTAATNSSAPVFSSLDLDPGGLTIMPDQSQIWMQGKISGAGSTVTAIVNDSDPIVMNRRDDDFGYLLPLNPGTNVIVLIGQDASGSNVTASLFLVNRTDAFQAAITSPAFGTFANGATQEVSGIVSKTYADGSATGLGLAGATLIAGDQTIPITNLVDQGDGTYAFDPPVPPSCGAMPLIMQLCWTNVSGQYVFPGIGVVTNNCPTMPLGLLEGYEIVSKVQFQQSAAPDPVLFNIGFEYEPSGPCWTAGYVDAGTVYSEYVGFHTYLETFNSQCTVSNNNWIWQDAPSIADSNGCSSDVTASEINWVPMPSSLVTWPTAGTNTIPQPPGRGMILGTSESVLEDLEEWKAPLTGTPDGGISELIPGTSFGTNDATMVINWPFYYPSGSNVLLTFEGMSFVGNASNVLYLGHPPVAIDGNDLSYWVTVGTGATFTIDATSFVWTNSSTNTDTGWIDLFGPTDQHRVLTWTTNNILSFTGFHNQQIIPTVVATQESQHKIINLKNKQIALTYSATNSFPSDFIIEWDFGTGGGYSSSGTIASLGATSITYVDATLPESIGNRRKDVIVKAHVKDRSGTVIAGSEAQATVRVALNTNLGQSFTSIPNTRQTELDGLGWNSMPPVAFDTASANMISAIQSNSGTTVDINVKRLAYSAQPLKVRFGFTYTQPPGQPEAGVYGSVIGVGGWSWNKQELRSIVNHESCMAIAGYDIVHGSGPYNHIFNDPNGGAAVCQAFYAGLAWCINVSDTKVSYKFLSDNIALPVNPVVTTIDQFVKYYNAAKLSLPNLSNTNIGAAKQLLKNMYNAAYNAFPEIINTNYTPHIDPP